MKAIQTAGLTMAMFAVVRFAGAQVLTKDVGIPLGTGWNPGGATIVITHGGTEGQIKDVTGILEQGFPPFTTASPGDVVLLNPTGGNARSNWAADLRFFNPLDPTGVQGLPATKIAAFFPVDFGPGGFAGFNLLPRYNLVTATTTAFGDVVGTDSLFGPVEGIFSGQLAIINFIAIHNPPAAVPEPGIPALLMAGGVSVAAFLRLRKRHKRATA